MSKKLAASNLAFQVFGGFIGTLNKKKIYMTQGLVKSRIYAVKSTKRGFSKKALTGIEIFFIVLGSYESSEDLKR